MAGEIQGAHNAPASELLPLLRDVERVGGPWLIEPRADGWACTVGFLLKPTRSIVIWSNKPFDWAHKGAFISALLRTASTTEKRLELCDALKNGLVEMLSVFIRQREVVA